MDLNGKVPSLSDVDIQYAKMLGYDYATKYNALPLKWENGRMWVAVPPHISSSALSDLADITGMFIVPVFVSAEDIKRYINQLLAPDAIGKVASQFVVDSQLHKSGGIHSPEVLAEISAAPAVRLIDSIIEMGILHRASDIHMEPCDGMLRTRCRIDGHLTTYSYVDISLLSSVISRLKIMGGMDISERRRPQDGRFTLTVSGEPIQFRLSIMPTAFGEKAAIRLLYGTMGYIPTKALGFFPQDLADIANMFQAPSGAIFITGPTGSGKSTTLNSFMREMDWQRLNIVTIEDPVENPIPGVNHISVDLGAGFSFPQALRYILRQDPDVIMVGEVRDKETAHMAIQASITGHLVLSTLHTNDGAGVIERLLDMGVEPYMLSAAVSGVISQRLVRKMCDQCKVAVTPTAEASHLLGIPQDATIYEGTGCDTCGHSGYKGRLAVYESIIFNGQMKQEMATNPYAFAETLRSQSTFLSNAKAHLMAGHTTVQEILALRTLAEPTIAKKNVKKNLPNPLTNDMKLL